MKTNSLILLGVFLAIISWTAASTVRAPDFIKLTPMENHHVIELNSNQPYVAGFHVNTPDLETYETVGATAITVSFPSTDVSYFPVDSWLGAGMFVQAQDSKLRNVDYGFYTMLVLDATGNLFLDVGMHQTRGASAPFHMPTEELIYAYTWKIGRISRETPMELSASWDSEGCVHYSISAAGFNHSLPPVNVISFQGCESIIPRFFAGNVVAVGPFPFSRYAQYLQFGVVSSTNIANSQWSADIKEPRLLRETGWALVDAAWSIQGDISYLDEDWMWGGTPYHGVSAEYYQNTLEHPHELIFFYNSQTLPPGTVLWENRSQDPPTTEADFSAFPVLNSETWGDLGLSLSILIITTGYLLRRGSTHSGRRNQSDPNFS